ncbi:hypothetical protein LCGC14_2411460 [marine sediment metagenome]|uniref:Uncharacterized protein n=1 Tax=marine sediment metagenome TaxID=412755 RepID=A0A0F9E4J8_9ZZZZ
MREFEKWYEEFGKKWASPRRHMCEESWKAALEWVLDMSDDRIDRDMLNEEVGRELEEI